MKLQQTDNKQSLEKAPAGSDKNANRNCEGKESGENEDDAAKKQLRSRKMISSTAATPEWLRNMFQLPPDAVCVHVQHKDNCLPHFQARLGDRCVHQGKTLACRFAFFLLSVLS